MSLYHLIDDALDRYERRYRGFFGALTQSAESAAVVLALRAQMHQSAEDRELLREVNSQLVDRLKAKSALRTELELALDAYQVEQERDARARATRVAVARSAGAIARPAVAVASPAAVVARPAVSVARPAVIVARPVVSVAGPAVALVPRSSPVAAVAPVSAASPYEGIPFRRLQMGAQFNGAQYSKGWWFANLWEEVRVIDFSGLPDQQDLEAERDQLLALAYETVFGHDVVPTARTVTRFNSGELTPKKMPAENDLTRMLLFTLFQYGHEQFGTTKLPFHRHKRAGGYLKDAAALFKKRIYQPAAAIGVAPANGMQDLASLIAFRGEGRNAETLIAHGGARRKHLSMAAELNVDKPWHPFYGRVPLDMYYRRGAQDNCLITVHSVAAVFDEATKFPLLSDRQIYNFEYPAGPVRASTAAVKAAGAAIAKVSTAAGDQWLVGTETSVHILTIAGQVGDTEQHQIDDRVGNPFRERATGDIALAQYLAVVRIRRVHYGPSWEDGHTVFVQKVQVIDAARKIAIDLPSAGPSVAATAALGARVNAAEAIAQLRAYLGSVRNINVSRVAKATAILEWDAR